VKIRREMVCVKTQVSQKGNFFLGSVPPMGDGRSGKIESPASVVHHDLHHVGIKIIHFVLYTSAGKSQGRHGAARAFLERLYETIDHDRLDQRLISLDVDDDIVGRKPDEPPGFGQAVRAAGVAGAGHHGFAAEGLYGLQDARVVRRHQHPVQAPGAGCTLKDPLNHGLAVDVGKGLSRESAGLIPGGNDSDDLHGDFQSWPRKTRKAQGGRKSHLSGLCVPSRDSCAM
jgi:hypothetical protein